MRQKGEGSIRQRADGRWEARAVFNESGRSRRRSFFGRTAAEARKKMRDAMRHAEDNLPIPDGRLAVKTYLANWLQGQRSRLSAESLRRYAGRLARLDPYIGDARLVKLQPADIRAAYAGIGQEVSGTTVQLIHGVLHVALRDAEVDGLIARNPASLVRPPARTTEEYRSLNPLDARALLTAAKGDPLEAFYLTAVTCGLRLGELQALKWPDLDLDLGRLTVRRTLAVDGKPVFSPSTSKKNHQRTVRLAAATIESLECHKAVQAAQRAAAGDAWNEHGLVFTNAVGNPLDGRNIRARSFPRLLARAGLAPMRFHDLRHSAASLLLADGVPVKVVSEMLGHTDVATTLRIYAHVIEGAQEQAASSMDRLFRA